MKKLLYYLLLLPVMLLLNSDAQLKNELFNTVSVNADLSLVPNNWYQLAVESIRKKEYEIKSSGANKQFTGFNRKNNFKTNFTANSFSISPAKDSADKWLLACNVKGIYSGNKKIFSVSKYPVAGAAGNQIRFTHQNNFTVEYINSAEGIRQNFIIHKQPVVKSNKLSVKLNINKGWTITQPHPNELHFSKQVNDEFEKKVTCNSLKVWDANNKTLPAHFALYHNNEIGIEVDAKDAVYPVTIDPLSTNADWQVIAAASGTNFGLSISTAGDVNGDGYSDVIVAANTTTAVPQSGTVYVFHGSATGPSATANWSYSASSQSFGYSVNTAGDVNGDGYSDIIIGATAYSNGQGGEGRAVVFHGSATGLSAAPNWSVESNQASANFGSSVSTAGDVNGDGYSDVIVGAVLYDNGQSNEGAAFVYHGSAAGLSTTAAWSAESNLAIGYMGGEDKSVACAGDVNGDGYSDVVVGAYRYGLGGPGRIWVYHGSATGLNTTASFANSGPSSSVYGLSVAGAGDINGDGYGDIITGARFTGSTFTNEGALYVYYGSATGITLTGSWIFYSGQADASLGISAAGAGDINGDGFADVIAGASSYDESHTGEGQLFVFYGRAAGLAATPSYTISDANQDNAFLGESVFPAGDVNGDGYADIFASATNYNSVGAVFVYNGSPNGLNAAADWTEEINQADAELGEVRLAGDVNSDGYNDVLVLCEAFDGGPNPNEMAAFVYYGTASGLPASPNWTYYLGAAPIPGISLTGNGIGDVNGDGYGDIMIGMPRYSNGQTFEGRSLAFYGSASGLNTTPNWSFESNVVGINSGVSVAAAGDVNGDGYSDAVIGASANNGSIIARVFAFYGSATGMAASPDWSYVNSSFPGSYFGTSVAGAGDINGDGYSDIIVGADRGINGDQSFGQLYVFNGSAIGLGSTYNQLIQENQSFALWGQHVASAGDVNGDGFSDVIVGSPSYNNGPDDEGAAFIFHGSAGGLNTTPSWTAESNQANAWLSSISSAGDINGDGYSDVVIGFANYDNGESNEGTVYVYPGSPSGISATPVSTYESNQASAGLGTSVAGAGDVNGDGFGDIIAAAPFFDNGQSNEGRLFLYYGGGVDGVRNNLKLYNSDLITPITQSQINPNLFGAGLFAKSPLGRQRGRLVWDVRAQGIPFLGSPINTSTQFFAQAAAFSDLGMAGTELKYQVAKQGFQTKIRARVEYRRTTAFTGHVYGPWRYPAGYTLGFHGMNAVPLPFKLLSFTGSLRQKNDAVLNWITEDETEVKQFEIQRSSNGTDFTTIGVTPANGRADRSSYSFTDTNNKPPKIYYRLKISKHTGAVTYSEVIVLTAVQQQLSIYPNPAKDYIVIGRAESTNAFVKIMNTSGQVVMQQVITGAAVRVNISHLLPGVYYVQFERNKELIATKLVKQ